jgi:hypothetical protein
MSEFHFANKHVALYQQLLGPLDPAEEKKKFLYACANGDIDQVLDGLTATVGQNWIPGCLQNLAANNHEDLILILHHVAPVNGLACIYTTITLACEYGYFELARKLKNTPQVSISDETFAHLCLSGAHSDNSIETLIEKLNLTKLTPYSYFGRFVRACMDGNLSKTLEAYDLCKNLDTGKLNSPGFETTWVCLYMFSSVANVGLCFAAGGGHVDIMDAMFERGANDTYEAFHAAVKTGRWIAVEKLINKSSLVTHYIYTESCYADDFKLTQMIGRNLAKKTSTAQMAIYHHDAFCAACKFGHIHLALNLLNTHENEFDWIIHGMEAALKSGYHKFAYYLCIAFADSITDGTTALTISTLQTPQRIMDTVANASTFSYWSNAIRARTIRSTSSIVIKEIPAAIHKQDVDFLTYEDCFNLIKEKYNEQSTMKDTYMLRLATIILKRQRELLIKETSLSLDEISIVVQY